MNPLLVPDGNEEWVAPLREFFSPMEPSQLDNFMWLLQTCAMATVQPEIIQSAIETLWHPLNGEEIAKFERLFRNLCNHSHLWELHGHTYSSYCLETGHEPPQFHYPTGEIKNE
jgi:hypothetical protein